MNHNEIQTIAWQDLDEATTNLCISLWHLIWPNDTNTLERAKRMSSEAKFLHSHHVHLLIEKGSLLTLARSFRQRILLGGNEMDILAIAGVCTHPSQRGLGLGKLVVQEAWKQLKSTDDLSLFQTEMPGFYVKLGARLINNTIISSKKGTRPFWNSYVMIYPNSLVWEDSMQVDLLGDGW